MDGRVAIFDLDWIYGGLLEFSEVIGYDDLGWVTSSGRVWLKRRWDLALD